MAFFKVEKKMMYTEVAYVEADSRADAIGMIGDIDDDFCRVYDDSWHDSDAIEVSEEEYAECTE